MSVFKLPNNINKYAQEKKTEEVNYWFSEPTVTLASIIKQCVCSFDTEIAYGYPNVHTIIGSDHGDGSSLFLMHANLLLLKSFCNH